MTAPVMPARHLARRRSFLSRVLLAVAFLVPVTVLFLQAWQADSDKVAAARSEQDGLRYLATLQPVMSAVADAQSIAVGGGAVSFKIIDPAVVAASEVDEQLGARLQSTVLWNDARNGIAGLHNTVLKPADAVVKYGLVSSVLLQLADKVRQTSGLSRDPDPDTYFLQDAAVHQLPASIVAAGQYGDYVVLGLNATLAEQPGDNANIITARTALVGAALTLGTDVQSAVDATASATLSADLLDKLDKYRQSIDGLAPATQIPSAGHTSAQDNAQVAADKANVVKAASALNTTMFAALGELLDTRIASVNSHRWLVAGTGVAAVVIALVPLLLLAVRRTNRIGRPAIADRDLELDLPLSGRGYPDPAPRRRRTADDDDRMPDRRGDPLPSRLSAPRQWPTSPMERDSWEHTGVPR